MWRSWATTPYQYDNDISFLQRANLAFPPSFGKWWITWIVRYHLHLCGTIPASGSTTLLNISLVSLERDAFNKEECYHIWPTTKVCLVSFLNVTNVGMQAFYTNRLKVCLFYSPRITFHAFTTLTHVIRCNHHCHLSWIPDRLQLPLLLSYIETLNIIAESQRITFVMGYNLSP